MDILHLRRSVKEALLTAIWLNFIIQCVNSFKNELEIKKKTSPVNKRHLGDFY